MYSAVLYEYSACSDVFYISLVCYIIVLCHKDTVRELLRCVWLVFYLIWSEMNLYEYVQCIATYRWCICHCLVSLCHKDTLKYTYLYIYRSVTLHCLYVCLNVVFIKCSRVHLREKETPHSTLYVLCTMYMLYRNISNQYFTFESFYYQERSLYLNILISMTFSPASDQYDNLCGYFYYIFCIDTGWFIIAPLVIMP